MQFRHLGKSGLKVSAIAYGNWITHASQIETEQANACISAALDAGINFFDTADVYANTRAEEVLGNALESQRREDLVIATKVYFPTGPGGPNDTGLSRKHIMESINGSLRRLKTDYVDLYQAHRFDHFTPLEETMSAFADVVHCGKAHYIGVSEWTPDQLRAGHALAREHKIDLISNQPQYSLLWRIIESEVVPTSAELGISQIVFSPLAQGILTGKYEPDKEPPAGSRATDQGSGADFISGWLKNTEVLTRVAALRPIAEDLGTTLAKLALAWVLRNENVAAAIIGATRPAQISENVGALELELSDDVIRKIDEVLGDAPNRNYATVGDSSPKQRLT